MMGGDYIEKVDRKVTFYLKKHGVEFLRYSLAIVFIWFGALKPLGASPATNLVANTVYFFDPVWFVPFLGYWEVIIGFCLLYKPFTRIGLVLMAVQMTGTFLPLIILPNVVYTQFPFVLTLEGQYIVKNLVLIAAGMVIASHLHDRDKVKKRK